MFLGSVSARDTHRTEYFVDCVVYAVLLPVMVREKVRKFRARSYFLPVMVRGKVRKIGARSYFLPVMVREKVRKIRARSYFSRDGSRKGTYVKFEQELGYFSGLKASCLFWTGVVVVRRWQPAYR